MEMITKKDAAYNYLRERILSGKLRAGHRLVISTVAIELGMSSVPVREALLQLGADGLIHMTPHVGAVVSVPSVDELLQVMESVSALEGYATSLAHPHITPQLPILRTATEAMRASSKERDWSTFNIHNREFHKAIYSSCPNEFLVKMIFELWEKGDSLHDRTIFFRIPTRSDTSIREHLEIIDQLADPTTKPEVLEATVRRHKLRTLDTLIDHLRRIRDGLVDD